MNDINYRRAIGYARKFDRGIAKDLVHDAYLLWLDKHDTNLFDQDLSIVFTIIKDRYWRIKQKLTFTYQRQIYPRYVISWDTEAPGDETSNLVVEEKFQQFTKTSSLDTLIEKDLLEKIAERLNEEQRIICNHLLDGYTRNEIGEIIGVGRYPAKLYYKVNKIKEQLEAILR